MGKKTIFINGRFYTPRKKTEIEAIAVRDGVIADLGANVNIRPLGRRGFKLVDLKKRRILPGFIDSHLHLLGLGNLFSRVNLDGVDSLDKIRSILKKASAGLAQGQWLRGRGWNKNLWGEDFPDKSFLDNITENPIALNSKDGHLIWVNSTALKLCGVTAATADPPGGHILKDRAGAPTGVLQENAVDLITDKIPRQSENEKKIAIKAAQKHLLEYGIIGVGDCDTDIRLNAVYQRLEEDGELHLRVFKMIHPDDLKLAAESRFTTGQGGGHFRIGCLKLFADGALGSQTAYMFKPYVRSNGNAGIQTLTPIQLDEYIKKAVDMGISVATHAIGDKANSQVLTAYGKLSGLFSKKNLRPRIEHAQILRKRDIPLFASYGVIASVQPIHCTSDRDISDRYLGARGRYAYPFKTMLRSGATLAFGSDAPIETANPLAGIHAAVCRKRPRESRRAWYPEERITVAQAIRAYTAGAARACCFDDVTGVIALGKKADFAVLSDDILSMRPDDIHAARCLATVVDGEFVYGGENLP